jgi:hypothetical protein
MYYPKQPLKVTGNGEIGTNAAQFAIIADTISIEGNGQLKIKIGQNYASTGLPDLPASGEIVYLKLIKELRWEAAVITDGVHARSGEHILARIPSASSRAFP